MSLGLSKNCKERLKEELVEILPSIVVEKNYFIKWSSKYNINSLEVVLPQHGTIKNKIDEYIGEDPFSEFVFEYLSKELRNINKYISEDSDKLLNSIREFSDITIIAHNIVELFDTLPWEYSITLSLENEITHLFSREIKEYSLSKSAKLIAPNDGFITDYPFRTQKDKEEKIYEKSIGILNVLSPKPLQWFKEKVYLNILVSGFIKSYGLTSTYERIIDQIKAFLGLAVALRLYRVQYRYHDFMTNLSFVIHKKFGETWFYDETISLDANLSERISDLILHDLDGNLDTELKKVLWIKSVLDDIGIVFSNMERAEKIVLASKWFFESYLGRNELLSFIQTNVALEILLGERAVSDLVGLGELLGNRCAYLIGDSNQQRESILKEFKQIYGIRSGIVHRGKSKLSNPEKFLFYKLQWMCRRVIQKEIELLKKDLIKS